MQLNTADARVYVNAAALVPENDTSDESDSVVSRVTNDSDIETDGMPPLYESSNDSGQETTVGDSPSVHTRTAITSSQKASRAKRVSANFAKLSRKHVVLKDESAQRLKQLDMQQQQLGRLFQKMVLLK